MTDYLFFSKILLRRLNYFGYGEEKLRSYKGQDSTYYEERKWAGTDRRGWTNRAGWNVYNPENHTHEADKYGNISDCFQNLSWSVEPLKKGFDFFHNKRG